MEKGGPDKRERAIDLSRRQFLAKSLKISSIAAGALLLGIGVGYEDEAIAEICMVVDERCGCCHYSEYSNYSNYSNYVNTCTSPESGVTWTAPSPMTAGSAIRAVHISELRAAIDNARSNAGLAAYSWTDGSGETMTAGTPIRAIHIAEMRTAITEVYSQCGKAAPGFNDATITAGSTAIRAVHINDLRSAVNNAP